MSCSKYEWLYRLLGAILYSEYISKQKCNRYILLVVKTKFINLAAYSMNIYTSVVIDPYSRKLTPVYISRYLIFGSIFIMNLSF